MSRLTDGNVNETIKPAQIIEYVAKTGESPFGLWFDSLDAVVAARLAAALARLAQGSWSHVRSVGSGVHELRLDVGPGYRVYFGIEGQRAVILLGGGTKRRQQADIERAVVAWRTALRHGREGGVRWH